MTHPSPQSDNGKDDTELKPEYRDLNLTSNDDQSQVTEHFTNISISSQPGLNQLQRPRIDPESLAKGRTRRLDSPQLLQRWNLRTKISAWAIAISVIPVLSVGTAIYLSSQLHQQLPTRQTSVAGPETTTLRPQSSILWMETGGIAFLTGIFAAFIANRAMRPVLSAVATSAAMVNRLQREEVSPDIRVARKDELLDLKTNINLVEAHLQELLWRQEAEAERSQLLMEITRRLRASHSEEEVFRITVEEVRKAFRLDRVVIFRFDSNWDGTFVEESVAPGWPKILWATVKDPCFAGGYIEQYRGGRVRAIDNIYQAGLSDCHIGLLERFAVKANLVAPIVKNHQLFGLLIAHQCSDPRFWQQSEIDLFAQLGAQVGFALEHAELLERLDTRANQAQLFINVTRRLRASLNEEDVLNTTVEEVRRAMRTDRVIVYGFDENWYGTVIAESVLPGFPKTLWAEIKDPCFQEGYVQKYQAGRVQASNNIYEANLTDCHIRQLEPFAVKANLVAPILKDDKLLGLLIAHECSKPRNWTQPEIDLFSQLAMQVGFALDHARLHQQVEQAYQTATAASHKQVEHNAALQHQLLEVIKNTSPKLETLSTIVLSQMETVTVAYTQIQTLVNGLQGIANDAQQAKLQGQQSLQIIQAGQERTNLADESIATVRNTLMEVSKPAKLLNQRSQNLVQGVSLMSGVVSQMKLQAMNAVLESTRTGEASNTVATIAEKVYVLARQLDTDIAKIRPLATEIMTETHEVADAIKAGTEQTLMGNQLIKETQQKLTQISILSEQMNASSSAIAQATVNQISILTAASQAVLEVANTASQTSERALEVSESLKPLAVVAREL